MICAPRSSRMSCETAFTVPAVPTGINAGVSTSPWAGWMRDWRAALAWACMVKGRATASMLQKNVLLVVDVTAPERTDDSTHCCHGYARNDLPCRTDAEFCCAFIPAQGRLCSQCRNRGQDSRSSPDSGLRRKENPG